jgi:molecular chaperone DnaJ
MNLKAAYQVLGLSESANLEEIRSAYRRLARKYHPDVQGTGDSKTFILIGAAYALISDSLSEAKSQDRSSVPV